MFIFVLAIVFLYGAYSVAVFWNASRISAPLINATPPFNREDASLTKHILVLGDSLVVGVGAAPAQTVAGRLSQSLNASVENYGRSGAKTTDLAAQASQAKKAVYDLVLIQIGANDVIQLRSLASAEANMDLALAEAKKKSTQVVFLMAGNIGDAPLWPWPWPYIYTKRTLDLRARYQALALKHDALFVDLYTRGDLFASDPTRFYAADKLHLSADGYEKWFDVITEEIATRWPALAR